MTINIQIDDLVREATALEIETIELRQSEAKAEKAEAESKAAQKAALLDRLGINEDEAKLLLS
jgi:regulator of replication initiation timing